MLRSGHLAYSSVSPGFPTNLLRDHRERSPKPASCALNASLTETPGHASTIKIAVEHAEVAPQDRPARTQPDSDRPMQPRADRNSSKTQPQSTMPAAPAHRSGQANQASPPEAIRPTAARLPSRGSEIRKCIATDPSQLRVSHATVVNRPSLGVCEARASGCL